MELDLLATLIISVLVLWIGASASKRVPPLAKLQLPDAVTGGIVCSLVIAGISVASGQPITFDLTLRDALLLLFFSSIGLGARLDDMAKGGRTLLKLSVVVAAFLFMQNLVGVALALLLDKPPGFGLLGGSVSLAGGHGTAISWGKFAEEQGHSGVTEVGVAFATVGLICGGLVGAPLGAWLLRRHRLEAGSPKYEGVAPSASRTDPAAPAGGESDRSLVSSRSVINALFMFAICVALGETMNNWLGATGIMLPGFLTAMASGILLSNVGRWRGWDIHAPSVSLLGDVSLELFLAMSLMSMNLLGLSAYLGPIALMMAGQVVLVVVVASFIVFRVAGRDFDAAVISAGFAGIALGATPVAVANMQALTARYGASTKAFIVIPLLGAFFLDIVNAFAIQLWISLIS